MQFRILSRTGAKSYFYHPLDHDCVVISITDIDSDPVHFAQNNRIKAILRRSFADTDANVPNAMQKEDADRIVEFVSRWKDQVEEIIVHCEAGISRSAGVCAALMLWLNGTDSPIFDNAYFHPNMRCYRLVLNSVGAFNGEHLYVQVEIMLEQGKSLLEIQKELCLTDDELETALSYIQHRS